MKSLDFHFNHKKLTEFKKKTLNKQGQIQKIVIEKVGV